MTIDQFIDKLKTLEISLYKNAERRPNGCRYDDDFKHQKENQYNKNSVLKENWSTGGIGGGSCWDEGESEHYATPGNDEPDFSDLDTILLHCCEKPPNFMEYKEILKIKEEFDYSQNEYYGNSTSYRVKFITVKKLYEKLNEMGLL